MRYSTPCIDNTAALAAMSKVSPRAPTSLEPLSTTPPRPLPTAQLSDEAVRRTGQQVPVPQSIRPAEINMAGAASLSGSPKLEGNEASVKSPRLAPLLHDEAPIEEKLELTFENAQPNWIENEKKRKKSTLFGAACAEELGNLNIEPVEEARSNKAALKKEPSHVYDLYYTKQLQNSMTDPNLLSLLSEAGTITTSTTTTTENGGDTGTTGDSTLSAGSYSQKETQHRRQRSSTDMPMIVEHALMDDINRAVASVTIGPRLAALSPLVSPEAASGKFALPEVSVTTPRSRRHTSTDASNMGRICSGSGKYSSNAAALFLAANARASGEEQGSGRIRVGMSSSRIMNRMGSRDFSDESSAKHNPSGKYRTQQPDVTSKAGKAGAAVTAHQQSAKEQVRTDENGYIIDDFSATSVTDTVPHRR